MNYSTIISLIPKGKAMHGIESIFNETGAKNGLEIALDENGACTLELADGQEGKGGEDDEDGVGRRA